MSKSTDIRIKSANCEIEPVTFRMPLKFGGRVQTRTYLINVDVVVETRDGKKHASGIGSMPVGNIWAWPSEVVTPEQSEAALIEFAREAVRLGDICHEDGHPIDLIYHLSAEYDHSGKVIAQKMKLPEPIPHLALMVAASPLDAALHDAFGHLHGLNSYNTLSNKFMSYDLTEYLDQNFKGEYLDRYTLREPKASLPLYHLVGALDPLSPADVQTRINDGLPESLDQWILANGLTHLKIKLAGDHFDWDLDRVLSIDNIASTMQAKRSCANWFYSLDFNEKCPNIQYVVDFLNQLKSRNPLAYDRIQYIEQPIHRNLQAHSEKVHAASALKPVVIDESLVDYDSLLLSRELGYSGIALKACKGHTDTLLLAAAAQKFGMFICVQDLTCPGTSFLHSASIAARIPGVAAIEGNARQYCPAANKPFAKLFPGMFEITQGTVNTSLLNGPGLGY